MEIDDNFFDNVDFSDNNNQNTKKTPFIVLQDEPDELKKESDETVSEEEPAIIPEKESEQITIVESKPIIPTAAVHKTVIAEDCQITGEIKSKSEVIVLGIVRNGDVKAGGTVTLGPSGFVENGLYSKNDVLINKRMNDESKYINGPIQGNSIVIDGGFIKGNIKSENKVTLSKDGIIVGNIICKNAIIKGAISGDIVADGNVDLMESAIVKGSVTAATININDGAILDGTFTLTTKKNVDYDAIFK